MNLNMNQFNKMIIHGGKFIAKIIQQNSTKVLMAGNIVSIFLTGYCAAKAAPVANKKMADLKEEYPDGVPAMEVVKQVVPIYGKAIAAGATGIACAIGADVQHERQKAVLAGLYSASELAFNEYKDVVANKFGKEEEQKIEEEVVHREVVRTNKELDFDSLIIPCSGSGKFLYRDEFTKRYFRSDPVHLKKTVNLMNDWIRGNDFIVVNDYYGEINLDPIEFGNLLGWNTNNEFDIYEMEPIKAPSGEAAIPIRFAERPKSHFNDIYREIR